VQPTATIPHPNKPEIRVTVRKLTRRQINDIFDKINADRYEEAITDHHGEVMRDPSGRPITEAKYRGSSAERAALKLRAAFVSCEGATDGDGKPVTAATVLELWEDRFDCRFDHCVICEGDISKHGFDDDGKLKADHLYFGVQNFGGYLTDKLGDEKTFDSDQPQTGSV
jgi:hypothetical protein